MQTEFSLLDQHCDLGNRVGLGAFGKKDAGDGGYAKVSI